MILTRQANADAGDPQIAPGQWQTIFLFLPPNTPPTAEDYILTTSGPGPNGMPGYLPDGVTWNTVLNWTYPPSLLTTLAAADVRIDGLYLQRSSTALNMPNPSANLYSIPFFPPAAVSDPNWTTIFSNTSGPPTTYTDTTVPNPWFTYRLIVALIPVV